LGGALRDTIRSKERGKCIEKIAISDIANSNLRSERLEEAMTEVRLDEAKPVVPSQ